MNLLMGDLLSQLDPTVVYIVVAILVISAILALIKKAIKITILVVVVAFAVSTLGPMAKNFQENYKFNVQDGVATIQIYDQTIKLDKDTVKNVELVNKGISGYTLNVKYDDGIGTINIPTFMITMVKSFVNKYNIPVKIIE